MLVPFLAIIASGTKGSTTPIVVAGLALAAVAMLLWKRELLVPVVVDLLVVGASLGLVLIVVFHGSSAGLALGVTESAKQTSLAVYLGGVPSRELVLIASGTAIIGGLTRAAVVFVLPFHRAGRADPVTWLLMGASIAGAVAVGIFPTRARARATSSSLPSRSRRSAPRSGSSGSGTGSAPGGPRPLPPSPSWPASPCTSARPPSSARWVGTSGTSRCR